ncbi:MAG: EamA family transporter, partial [Acinetobacter sp.]|nr:EamA family transporter [Acinetobacter sp.]
MTLKDVFIALLVIMIWGVNFWFMKIALGDVPPLVLGLLRFLCVLMPAIFFIKKPSTSWKLLIAYGLTISFGQFSFVFLALSLGFATGLAALILQTQVFLTVIFASIYFKESIKIHQL